MTTPVLKLSLLREGENAKGERGADRGFASLAGHVKAQTPSKWITEEQRREGAFFFREPTYIV